MAPAPGGLADTGVSATGTARKLLSVVRPYALRLVVAGAAGVGAELCAVALMASAAWLIARAGQHPPLSALALAIVAVRACGLLRGVLRYGERLAGHDAALRALAGLRVRVYEALRRSPRGAPREADLVTRMVSDVEAVQDLLLRVVMPVVTASVVAAVAVTTTAALLPTAGAVSAAGLLVAGVGVSALAGIGARASARRAARTRAELAVRSLDVVRGAVDLAAFGATGRAVDAADETAGRLKRLERRAGAVESAANALAVAVQGLTALAVTWTALRADVGGVRVTVLALTTLVAFEAVLPLTGAARRLTEIVPAMRRVAAVLALPPAVEPVTARRDLAADTPPDIGLHGVRVSYREGASDALNGVDLRVAPGRRVAIVGASGAGKSTLLAALVGEVTACAGTVTLNGADIGAYGPAAVRRTVRGLAQDAHVFATSIRANVALARPDAPESDLTAAAHAAGLLGWVDTLPHGWDTRVDDAELSGGQRQRLLLARALLADPPVLVLDEPTEGLDVATADALVDRLLTDRTRRTVIMVTHRLAPLPAADEVVVLDRGRIAQRGPHAALVDRPGPYRDLWEAEELAGRGVPVGAANLRR